MPTADQNPYSATSVWNKGVSASATFSTDVKIAQPPVGLSSWLQNDSSSLPMYSATTAAPVEKILHNPDTWWNVYQGTWKQTGNTAAVEAQILAASSEKFPFTYHPYVSQSGTSHVLPTGYDPITNPDSGARTAHVPAGVKPTVNPDGQMTVWQPDGKVLETFGTIVLSDGTIVASTYKITDPAGEGNGYQNGTTASMIPVYSGVLRNDEIADGVVDHALKLVVPAGLLTTSYTGPALTFDRGALTENPPYSGDLPMGSHLAIPKSIDISTLGLSTAFGQTIAKTMQDYGAVITDRGGSGITIITETGMLDRTYDTYSSTASADLDKIFNAVQRVQTNAEAPPDPEAPTFSGVSFAGTASDDTIIGNDLNNIISGNGGVDIIKGKNGNDTLIGGAGSDSLWGGFGGDVFDYNAIETTIDFIGDWQTGDRIDLMTIDADVTRNRDQAFSFIGTAPLTGKNQVGYTHDAANDLTVVRMSVDTDADAEMLIMLAGLQQMTASSFVL